MYFILIAGRSIRTGARYRCCFLLGICWKRTSAQGGMWGLIAGMVIGLTRLGAKVYYSNAGEVADSTFKYLFYDMNWLFFVDGCSCSALL